MVASETIERVHRELMPWNVTFQTYKVPWNPCAWTGTARAFFEAQIRKQRCYKEQSAQELMPKQLGCSFNLKDCKDYRI